MRLEKRLFGRTYDVDKLTFSSEKVQSFLNLKPHTYAKWCSLGYAQKKDYSIDDLFRITSIRMQRYAGIAPNIGVKNYEFFLNQREKYGSRIPLTFSQFIVHSHFQRKSEIEYSLTSQPLELTLDKLKQPIIIFIDEEIKRKTIDGIKKAVQENKPTKKVAIVINGFNFRQMVYNFVYNNKFS